MKPHSTSTLLTVLHDTKEWETRIDGDIKSVQVNGQKLNDIHDLAQKIDRMTRITKGLAVIATILAIIAVVGIYGEIYADNGNLSEEERAEIHRSIHQGMMAKFDKDGDRKLNPEERKAASEFGHPTNIRDKGWRKIGDKWSSSKLDYGNSLPTKP